MSTTFIHTAMFDRGNSQKYLVMLTLTECVCGKKSNENHYSILIIADDVTSTTKLFYFHSSLSIHTNSRTEIVYYQDSDL